MTVLVTGAAGGQQGKTGRRVTELLRARDIPVRAMVRTDDDRAEYLRGLGAEVVVGDFLDHGSLRRAVDASRRCTSPIRCRRACWRRRSTWRWPLATRASRGWWTW